MAAEAPKPHIEILHKSFSQVPDEKGQLQPLTHIVFRDETGRIGTITIPKKEPSEADIKEAIKKQREAETARKRQIITL